MMREYQGMEQALAGEKEDNPWAWVRKRLIGVRGYKPWFGHLFTKDQQEMRYRDIHADLRTVKEQIEKAAKEKVKDAKGNVAAGGGGSGSAKGKGPMETKRPAYTEMDPMRRAHLFGVSIQAHVVPPWARQESEDAARAASEAAGSAAGGEGSSLGKHGAESGGQATTGMAKGAKKRKPVAQKQGGSGDAKAQKVAAPAAAAAVGKGNRSTRDRAWIRSVPSCRCFQDGRLLG